MARPGSRLRCLGVGAVGLASLVTASCSSDTVRLGLSPAVGARAVYRITVRAETVTTIGEGEPRRRVQDTVLVARHRVLESGPDGSRIEVRLSAEREGESRFDVRFDRAGQAVEVQRIEGLPAQALGDLGLSEIYPAAAAAPPDRPLAPGDRWDIDEPVTFAGPTSARAVGEGRLVRLEAADGRRLAQVETDYRLPVQRTAEETAGRLLLDGSLDTRARVAYDLDADLVEWVQATSRGRYRVTLLPPAGLAGTPVPGTLVVDVESSTRRVS